MMNRVRDGLAERSQLIDRVLRHDAQRSWKLCVLHAVALALGILESSERIGLVFRLEESAFSPSGFAVVHHEFEVRTFLVFVLANLDFARSHGLNRCHMVAAKTSNFALLCVFLCYNE
jgi:hypothetical protein